MQYPPAYPNHPPYHNPHTFFVLPTYACNLRCPHCCTSVHPAAGTMTAEEFEALLRRLRREITGRIDLRFIGGEPGIWAPLDSALSAAAQTEDVFTSVFSNLIHPPRVQPDMLFFAINSCFVQSDAALQRRAQDNFAACYRALDPGKVLVTRYVVTEQTTPSEVDALVEFVRRFPRSGVGIGFDVDLFARTPRGDAARKRRIGESVIHVLKTLRKAVGARRLQVHDIMPLCIFPPEQLPSLRSSFLLRGICTSPEGSLVLLPGGWAQLCPNTPHRVRIDDSIALEDLSRSFEAMCDKARWTRRDRCGDCAHFLARECQGGCLGPSFHALGAEPARSHPSQCGAWAPG